MEEPFNEDRVGWEKGYKNYRRLVEDVPTLDVQLADIFASHNGFKLLDYQLPKEMLTHIFENESNRFIFLQRKNLLQAVVSILIAHQTQLWQIWDANKPVVEYYKRLKPLAIEDVKQRVATLKQDLADFERCINRFAAGRLYKLSYEDFYFSSDVNQLQMLIEIWDFLDVERFFSAEMKRHLSVDQAKINGAETYKHLPNAAEINQACGSDETGWLL